MDFVFILGKDDLWKKFYEIWRVYVEYKYDKVVELCYFKEILENSLFNIEM